ncbi:unnamed protein product [Closterium sp. Naga37s-1]|nr:unnamed protein product [Closterium sp. Naga37s-1]
MALWSLRSAFVLAVLPSLSCSAIAGRHLLQTSNTRYQSSSTLFSGFFFNASCTLDANVTATDQTSSIEQHQIPCGRVSVLNIYTSSGRHLDLHRQHNGYT